MSSGLVKSLLATSVFNNSSAKFKRCECRWVLQHAAGLWKPQHRACVCAGRDSATLTVSITTVFMVWGNLLPCVQEPRLKPEPDVSQVILTWDGSLQLDGRNCLKSTTNPSFSLLLCMGSQEEREVGGQGSNPTNLKQVERFYDLSCVCKWWRY